MTATPRRRLDQIDAMRPIKQAGVVSTHCIIYFAPAAATWAAITTATSQPRLGDRLPDGSISTPNNSE